MNHIRSAGRCPWALVALCALPLAAAPPQPRAQEAPEELDEVVVQVERLRQPQEDVAVPVTVITPAQLAPTAGRTVADVLASVPSLELRPNGAAAGTVGFSLRGAKAEQVLVLLNGRRVGTAQGGGVALEDLPLADVERIEVLRGGASALYGSDPIGGVINIVTKRGGDGRLRVRADYGSFDTFGLSATDGQRQARGDYRWSVEHFTQQGDFGYTDDSGVRRRRTNNSLQRNDLHLDGSYRVGAGQFDAGVGSYTARKGVAGLVTFPSPGARQRDERYNAHVGYQRPLGRGARFSSSFGWQSSSRDYEDKLAFYPVDSQHNNALLQGELLTSFDLRRGRQAALGCDWRQDYLSSTQDGQHTRQTAGLFGQYELGLGSLRLTPSVRLDGQTGQKLIVTPRLGLVLHASPRWTLRAGGNRSFRAPSFDDLYWPASATAAGNPLLAPERALELNAGVTWHPARRATLELDYFNRDTADQIVWEPGVGGRWSPQNIGRVRTQGLEFTTSAPVSFVRGLSARGSYAYLKATTHAGTPGATGRQLLLQPYHHGTLGLRYEGQRLTADLSANLAAKRYITVANTKSLPGYGVCDAGLRYRLSSGEELGCEIRNLFDHRYQTNVDYPLPGRELRVNVSRSF